METAVQLDEQFLVLEQLPLTIEELCQQISQIPTEVLQPYLTEQVQEQ